MRAAAEAGIDIPKLCATDSLEAFGSCRMCVVEVEGGRGVPASCTTLCSDGMKVNTKTEKVERLRRNTMELYMSDHPLDCRTGDRPGGCEMHDLADKVGLYGVRYGTDGENHLVAEKDTSNPYFDFDSSACIVCSRCVRACDEIQGTLRADDPGPRVRLAGVGRRHQLHGVRVRVLRRLRAGLPDRCPAGALDRRAGHADPLGDDDLRLLRRRLLVQGRDEGRRGRPDGAGQVRRRQRGPLVRQGPVRLRLRRRTRTA